jgi:hypothetical protein
MAERCDNQAILKPCLKQDSQTQDASAYCVAGKRIFSRHFSTIEHTLSNPAYCNSCFLRGFQVKSVMNSSLPACMNIGIRFRKLPHADTGEFGSPSNFLAIVEKGLH